MYIRELNSQVMTQWTTTTAIDPLRMAPTAMVIASLAGGNKYGTAKKVNLFSVRACIGLQKQSTMECGSGWIRLNVSY